MNMMVLTEEQKKRNGSLFNELAAKLTAAELAFLVTLLCDDPRTLNALLDDATLLGLKQSIGPHLVGAFSGSSCTASSGRQVTPEGTT